MKFFRMMKGLMPILAAAATTACAQTTAESQFDPNVVKIPTDKQKFHIFLLTGQSNMEGAGYPVLPEYLTGTTQVIELNDKMEWVKNVAPYGRGYGPGESFALHYAKLHPDVTVGVIHAARGGRSMRELSKGGRDNTDRAPNYDNLIKKIKFAQQQGEVKAMLWHQGETDAKRYGGKLSQAEFEDYYVARFSRMVQTLRKELDIPDLPVFVGEVGAFLPDLQKNLNPALATAVRGLPHCALVPSADLNTCMPDNIHFDTAAQKTLGARYYDAFKRLSGRQGK